MNILLIGGSNALMNHLIQRFKKEGHRVFLLTGSRYKNEWYEKVFERYDFLYTAQNLPEVIESVDPDVTIYLGAYDSNYRWKNEENESVKYASGVSNMLMACSGQKDGRFVYLSSDSVYGIGQEEPITEDMPVSPNEYKGIAIAQGEEVCLSYQRSGKLEVVILRLAGLNAVPRNVSDCTDVISSMVLGQIRHREINGYEGRVYSVLYEPDAVQFIVQLSLSPHHEHVIYNATSSEVTSDEELAGLVKKETEPYLGPDELNIIHLSKGIQVHRILDNTRFNEEFGMNRVSSKEAIVSTIVSSMYEHKDVFLLEEDEKKPLWKRIYDNLGWLMKAAIPFIENLILFIPFFMLNNRATGSAYFSRLDFYLLYVLLFAIVHGQQQATFSAILATNGFIFRQMYTRSGLEVLTDYNTYVWIAQLFVLGLAVGYMRDRLRKLQEEAREDHDFMNEQLDDIKDINSSNVRIKDALEVQVISQNDSIGKVFEITSALDQYSNDEVMFYAAEIIEQMMGTKDVAIYNVVNGDYARLFTATSALAGSLGNSVRYREIGNIYEVLSKKKVFINRTLEEGLPMMANAIYEGDELKNIIMLWEIPWEKMTLGQANTLQVISLLIQNAVIRANRYLEVLHSQRFIENTRILNTEAFSELYNAYANAVKRHLTVFTLLRVITGGEDVISASEKIITKLRYSDYLGLSDDGKLYILLTNTNLENSVFVRNRLAELGYETMVLQEGGE